MRSLVALALLLATGAAAEARERYKPMPSMSWPALERLQDRLIRNPPMITRDRLPRHFELGRCLLVIKGHTYISGPCAYSTMKGGDFEAHGPRQVFAGVDYPDPKIQVAQISTDYWFTLERELHADGSTGPGWSAYWNEDKRATHAQTWLGTVVRKGACYSNADARMCLWKR